VCVKGGRFGIVFIREWNVVKTENKENTVLLKDDIVENMVVNKNPTTCMCDQGLQHLSVCAPGFTASVCVVRVYSICLCVVQGLQHLYV